MWNSKKNQDYLQLHFLSIDEFKPDVESESDDEETIEKDEEGIDEVVIDIYYFSLLLFLHMKGEQVSYFERELFHGSAKYSFWR